jgi:hypothetical protein
MSITTREARQLTTVAEWPLVEASLPNKIRDLSPVRLKAKVERARTMRTKYTDLAKRQHRKAQSKRSGTPNEKINARTKRKAELFAEVLARYEERLSAVEGRDSKSASASASSWRERASARTGDRGKATTGKSAKSAKRRAAKAQARDEGARKKPAAKKSAKSGRTAKNAPAAREAARGSKAAAKASPKSARDAEAAAADAARSATSVAPPVKVKKSRAPIVPKSSVHTRTGQHRIHAHVSSRGRRSQGRRDSR